MHRRLLSGRLKKASDLESEGIISSRERSLREWISPSRSGITPLSASLGWAPSLSASSLDRLTRNPRQ